MNIQKAILRWPWIALIALLVHPLNGASAQEYLEGTYEGVSFIDAAGDTFYASQVIASVWKDQWLLLLGIHGQQSNIYLADPTSRQLIRIGRYGGGPGEYYGALGSSARGDTLIVVHDALLASEFLLPEGKFLGRIQPPPGGYPQSQVWISSDEFYSSWLPSSLRTEGLFGRYSRQGELLQVFGEYDKYERFGGERMFVRVMNSGAVRLTPDDKLAFIYSHQAKMLLFSTDGALIREINLDMPWNDRVGPFRSQQVGGWAARPVRESVFPVDDGFLVACNGYRERDGFMRNVLAVYSWDGKLQKVINLPERPKTHPLEDFIMSAVEIRGEIWVTLMGSPEIRKVRIHP